MTFTPVFGVQTRLRTAISTQNASTTRRVARCRPPWSRYVASSITVRDRGYKARS
jgi:hypothetical protein